MSVAGVEADGRGVAMIVEVVGKEETVGTDMEESVVVLEDRLETAGLGGGWLATGAGSLPVLPNLSGIACLR
jgi:hypothetical protein